MFCFIKAPVPVRIGLFCGIGLALMALPWVLWYGAGKHFSNAFPWWFLLLDGLFFLLFAKLIYDAIRNNTVNTHHVKNKPSIRTPLTPPPVVEAAEVEGTRVKYTGLTPRTWCACCAWVSRVWFSPPNSWVHDHLRPTYTLSKLSPIPSTTSCLSTSVFPTGLSPIPTQQHKRCCRRLWLNSTRDQQIIQCCFLY